MESRIIMKRRFASTEPTKEWLITGIRLVCMFLFLYTAYAKLVDHDRFLKGLSGVHLISGLAVFISWFVPLIEILTFILLLIPYTAKSGLYLFLAMMVVFTGYISGVLLWAKIIPCHCGGVIENLSWTQHLWFNLAFIGLAIIALRLHKSNNQ
ncbi:MauE/DoxX family redox-associated membrane protein [Mucilaginibacter pankratovii]|nr:MauE/DoxX family redox-associated membrane protein [Mucilaginibacter pankratovii]